MRYLPIAMTPRSGSTVVCSCIQSMGLSSNIGELFNPRGPKQFFQQQLGELPPFGLMQACSRFSEDGELAIFKTSALDFESAVVENPEIIDALKVPFLFIDRKNKVAQGISLYRAKTSGVWHLPVADALAEREATLGGSTQKELAYDFNAIKKEVEFCERESQFWNVFFADNDLKVVRILYEDFVASPRDVICHALQQMCIDFDAESEMEMGFTKLATSDGWLDWEHKFRHDNGP